MSLANELAVCGLTAVLARFARDPESVRRLFFDTTTSRRLGAECKLLAATKRPYRCVEPAELEKIAGTVHHGGVVCIVRAPSLAAPLPRDIESWAAARATVVLLDRIGNAHNLGAIARSAAFFGASHLVVPAHPSAALPSEAAYRIAEGGLEHLRVWRVPSLAAFAQTLRASGYDVIGAATRGGHPVPRTSSNRPLALAVGNEESGLAPDLEKACSSLVTLAGSGRVESLNVSVAAAILLHALTTAPRTAHSDSVINPGLREK